MTYYLSIPLMLFLALVEASVLPLFRIGGLQPNLTLVVLVAWILVRGQKEALVLIPVAGICLGLLGAAAMGSALLAMAPLALLYDLREVHLGEGQFSLTLLLTLGATLIYQIIHLLIYFLFGEAGSWTSALVGIVLPTALLNLVVAVPVYFVVWSISGDTRRAAFA